QVKNGLQQAGFSDVQVVPRSFLVRAKDKDGQLVTMLINGNSIIQINGLPDDDAATTGSGMNSDTDPGSAPPGANTGGSSGANPAWGKKTSRNARSSPPAPKPEPRGRIGAEKSPY